MLLGIVVLFAIRVCHESGVDAADHVGDVLHHLVVREADHTVPAVREELGPRAVDHELIAGLVMPSVDLDDQLLLRAVEVEDEAPHRVLPLEPEAVDLLPPEIAPEHVLRHRLRLPHLPRGDLHRLARAPHPSHSPSPV